MIEKENFIKPINIDINVATIGINKDDWYCHNPGMKQNDVMETMLNKGFDVVPIVNKAGVFEKYFTINKYDNPKLDTNDIKEEDKLYYLTHVRDAIWIMKTKQKSYYFLTNGRGDNEIVGLLSLSNFNCREFYVFVFSLLSYVEREFAFLIESDTQEGFRILEKLSQTTELNEQLETIKKRYNEDREKQNENDYKEYLYLHHLIWLLKDEKKFEKLKYSNAQDFERGTSKLKDLRNNIAHPVKSLVRNLSDLDSLYIALNKLYEFKERLDNYLNKI